MPSTVKLAVILFADMEGYTGYDAGRSGIGGESVNRINERAIRQFPSKDFIVFRESPRHLKDRSKFMLLFGSIL